MSAETQIIQPSAEEKPKSNPNLNALIRIGKYTLYRLVSMVITVTIGVFLTIMIANMGGYLDNIRKSEINEQINVQVMADPNMKKLNADARNALIADRIKQEEHRVGLDQPFLIRTVGYLSNALTLSLGRSQYMSSASGSRQVRLIILERLPSTLVLFATAELLLFFTSVFFALFLSRRYGSFLDKFIVTISPMSSAPGWFYGIFFILIFAALLHWLPFGGMVDAPPPDNPVEYALSLLKHLILPVSAFMLSSIALNIYSWRTFFLIYSSEDYVEMAKAKGLTSRDIERRYILRPTLPTILTTFTLLLIGIWTGAPIFETVFQWPGLGRTLYQAVGLNDTPVIVASTVIFAYLLGVSVFLLDFVYALVDPRVKVGGEGKAS